MVRSHGGAVNLSMFFSLILLANVEVAGAESYSVKENEKTGCKNSDGAELAETTSLNGFESKCDYTCLDDSKQMPMHGYHSRYVQRKGIKHQMCFFPTAMECDNHYRTSQIISSGFCYTIKPSYPFCQKAVMQDSKTKKGEMPGKYMSTCLLTCPAQFTCALVTAIEKNCHFALVETRETTDGRGDVVAVPTYTSKRADFAKMLQKEAQNANSTGNASLPATTDFFDQFITHHTNNPKIDVILEPPKELTTATCTDCINAVGKVLASWGEVNNMMECGADAATTCTEKAAIQEFGKSLQAGTTSKTTSWCAAVLASKKSAKASDRFSVVPLAVLLACAFLLL